MRRVYVMVRRAVTVVVLGGLSLRAELVVVGFIVAGLVVYCWTIANSGRSRRLAMLIRAMRGDRSPPRRGPPGSFTTRSKD